MSAELLPAGESSGGQGRLPAAQEIEQAIAQAQADGDGREKASARLVQIARSSPELLLPYLKELGQMSDSAASQLRNASIEALSLVSKVAPSAMAFLIPRLHDLMANEPAELLRENALVILTNYAKTSRQAAERVLPALAAGIDKYGTRNAIRVLTALTEVVQRIPKLGKETVRIADRFQNSVTSGLRAAARRLLAASRASGTGTAVNDPEGPGERA